MAAHENEERNETPFMDRFMEGRPWVRNLTITLILLILFGLIFSVRQVLVPFFVALTIAYVGDPVIDRLEELKISRTWGIIILILALSLVLVGLCLYLLPKLIYELQDLTGKLPHYWEQLKNKLAPHWETYAAAHPDEINQVKNSAMVWLEENAGILIKNVSTGLATSFKSIGGFFATILSLVVIPVLAFYLLRDFDLMKEKLTALIPLKKRPFIVNLCHEMDEALRNFIQGQLLVALILSMIYSLGLWIAGCPYSMLIGIMAGFSNLIPYLGIALGFVPAVLLTYLAGQPTWAVVVAGLTFIVGQMLEGMVITPKIIGDSVGLHPAVVLVGLMIGGTYFGFVGMILALPVSAVLLVILKRTYNFYINSVLYHEGEIGTT